MKLVSNFSQLATGTNKKADRSIINCQSGPDVSLERGKIIGNNDQTNFQLSFIISDSNQNPVIGFNLAKTPRNDTLTDLEDYLTDDNYTNQQPSKN